MAQDQNEAFQRQLSIQEQLLAEVSVCGAALRQFPKNSIGITPDDVKASPEFRAAKAAYDAAFQGLRNFNSAFTKAFGNELRAHRLSQRGQRSAA